MNPDREDYSLDEVALMKAGINPMHCRDSVQCAIDRQLPGCYQAEANLMKLYEDCEAGILKPTRIIKPPIGVLGTDDIYISKEDAENWQPEAPPIQPANIEPKAPDRITHQEDKPSQTGTLLMLGLLIKELGFYEQGKKGGQDKTIAHIQELARQHKVYRNLSRTTLQRNIGAALDKLIEISNTYDN